MLLRPNEIEGESWPGYLMRLAQANDFNGIEGLADILGLTFMSLLISPQKEVLERLGIISVFATSSSKKCTTLNRSYMGAAGRTVRSRICPSCLESMPVPHIRASWDRALEVNCRIHLDRLCDECPACHTPITYRRRYVGCCNCGFKFSNAARNDGVALNVARLYQIFGLQDVYSRDAPTYSNSSPSEVAAVAVIQRLHLLEIGMSGKRRSSGAKGDAFLSAQTLMFLDAWLDHWPEGFIRSMVRTRKDIHTSPTALILGCSPNSSNEFPVLRSALKELDQRKRKSPRPGNRSPQMVKAAGVPFVGIRYLIKATGSSYDAVKHWISQGWLGQVEIYEVDNSRIGYRIDSVKAQKAIQIIKSTASARELSLSVGIDRSCLQALAQANVIRSIPYGKGAWNVRFHPTDVFQLATALLIISNRKGTSNDRRMMLHQAITFLRKKTPWLIKHFLDSVLEKQIPIFFIGLKPCRLDEISLLHEDLINWRNLNVKLQKDTNLTDKDDATTLLTIDRTVDKTC